MTCKRLNSQFKTDQIEKISVGESEFDFKQAIKESPPAIKQSDGKDQPAVDTASKYIGPITQENRLTKVRAYLKKKQQRFARNH